MDDALRVAMIVTNDAVSDPRVNKEAEALAAVGMRVTVFAWDRTGEAAESECLRGVTYERLGPPAEYGAGWRSLPRFWRFWREASRRAKDFDADVVHCHDLDTVPAGLMATAAPGNARLVIDHHELYLGSPMVPQRGLAGVLARAAVDLFDRYAARRATLLVIANPGNVARYEGMAPGKVVVVENAPEAGRFRPSDAKGPRFTVCYIGQKRYPDSLLRLIDVVSRHDDVQALMAGGGPAEGEIARAAEGVHGVETIGRVSYEEIPDLYAGCDAVYALYDPFMRNIRTSFPVKAMEGMACGLPVIVDAGTWVGDFVEREGVGLAVDSSDESAIEGAILRLKDDAETARAMGERGRMLVERGLSWEAAGNRLVAAYGGFAVTDGRSVGVGDGFDGG